MPGLNAIINLSREKQEGEKNLENVLQKMNYNEHFYFETIFKNKDVKIIFSGIKEYPIQKFDLGDKTIVIEGAIYNKSKEQIKSELSKILPAIVENPTKTTALSQFMFAADGEFIVYYIDNATGKVAIFNDAMGRLPAYYYFDKNQFIIGRALRFLSGNLPSVKTDDFGLIEYFLFSTPLGERTVLKNIFRMMPCALFVIDTKNGNVNKQILYHYNFDERWDDKPIDQYVKNLHDLFMESVSNRAAYFKDRTQILALSGGLDSRTILMGLLKCRAKFECITFVDYFNHLKRDLPVVDTLVKMYGVKQKHYQLIKDNIPDMERLIYWKDGCAPSGMMGSMLYSVEMLEKDFGRNLVYYTGDEGNYTTAPRYGGKKIVSIPDLLSQLLLRNSLSVFSIEDASRLSGKSKNEITDYICNYFSEYPEKDMIHKFDHFFYWERSFKFTMENQERFRFYFWPLSPHSGIQYAPYAFKIKNKYLAGWKIYAGLLKSLDKRSVGVKYANFGIPLNSPLMPFYLPIRGLATSNQAIREKLLLAIRILKNPKGIGRKTEEFAFLNEIKKYLANIITEDKAIKTIIDTNYLNNILADDKYIYRMYLAANIVKYLSLVENLKAK